MRFTNDSSFKPIHTSTLDEYRAHLIDVVIKKGYEQPECTLNLPFDTDIYEMSAALAHQLVTPSLKYIVVIGIGGSNLGTKAIYDALYGFYDVYEISRMPKMIFLDTQDSDIISKTITLLRSLESSKSFLINAISKSGSTTETAVNLEILYQGIKDRFPDCRERIVCTSDSGSKMDNAAKKMNIATLSIPRLVGGRYSVFSCVGIFPLIAAGVDVRGLIAGAKEIIEKELNSIHTPDANSARVSALVLYELYGKGKVIHDTFLFHPQLESLGKWYRQLMGESIGKDGKGITPTVSIGSTDLHSVGQLYLGGPKDKITTFIYSESDSVQSMRVPNSPEFGLVDAISNKTPYMIMRAIVEGTKIAYSHQSLPFMSIALSAINEKELGAFMQFKMIEMMYLGSLMKVNAFDQPHVELYKKETRTILSASVA